MRKVLFLVAILISMTTFLSAQNKVLDKVSDTATQTAVAATNVSSAGQILSNGLVNGTSALHKDAVDGISTIHQDLSQAVPAVYTDSKGVIKTLYDDGTKAINYLVPKVESVIQSLAIGLKTTTAEVWRILVYKQVALAVTNTIYVLLALLLLIVYIVGLKRITAKVNSTMNGWWSGGQTAFAVIGAIISIGCIGLIVVAIPTIVNGYMIPEAGALKEAVGLTQQLLQSFK